MIGALSLVGAPVAEAKQVISRPIAAAPAVVAGDNGIASQGQVKGVPGVRVSQELILTSGESLTISVDWASDLVTVQGGGDEVSSVSLSELQALAARVGSDQPQEYAGMTANPEDINWGSMCQWLAGLTGLGHAAIWSLVSPWMGIPYGVFWVWVGLQCK
ncbi:hypothetical protein GCM10027595_02970 [Corynebacterium nasicanis]